MPVGLSDGTSYTDSTDWFAASSAKQRADLAEINANTTSGDFQSRFYATDQSTMPPQASTELTGALKSYTGTRVPGNQYDTALTPFEEAKFQAWKSYYAPQDSGEDYDFRGAFKADATPDPTTNHWVDTFKKPNHPTFSDQSMYAVGADKAKAGRWEGDTFIPPEPYGLNPPEGNAIQSYVKAREEDIRNLPETIRNAPAKFKEDMEKRQSMTDSERMDEAINVAMGVSGGGLTFAGVRSAAVNKTALGHANILEMNGAHPDVILKETGFHRGADGRWKYEIDDSKSFFNKYWSEDIAKPNNWNDSRTARLDQILEHPELYKAYPALKNVQVVHDPQFTGGAQWEPWNNTIRTGDEFVKEHGVVMHEVQHVIQDIEGFAKGGSAGKAGEDYTLKYAKAVRDLMPEMQNLLTKDTTVGLTVEEAARARYLGKIAEKYVEYAKAGDKEALEYYYRLAGEVEARNTETRLLLTDKERRQITPKSTEDTARQGQIVLQEPATTSAYGVQDPVTGQLQKSEPTQFRRGANDNTPGLYNPREPNMIGSDEADRLMTADWNKFAKRQKDMFAIHDLELNLAGKRKLTEVDKARIAKMKKDYQKEHGVPFE